MPRINRGMHRTNIYIEDSHLKGARWLGKRQGKTMSDIIREAIKQHLLTELPRYSDERANDTDTAS